MVEAKDRAEFLSILDELGHERKRDGAFAWNVFEDAAERGRFLETFLIQTWLELMHARERVTNADRMLEEQVRRLLKDTRRMFTLSGRPGEHWPPLGKTDRSFSPIVDAGDAVSVTPGNARLAREPPGLFVENFNHLLEARRASAQHARIGLAEFEDQEDGAGRRAGAQRQSGKNIVALMRDSMPKPQNRKNDQIGHCDDERPGQRGC